jgi:hypothetical protein
MVYTQSANQNCDTDTKINDLCIMKFKRDSNKLESYLHSVQSYYSENEVHFKNSIVDSTIEQHAQNHPHEVDSTNIKYNKETSDTVKGSYNEFIQSDRFGNDSENKGRSNSRIPSTREDENGSIRRKVTQGKGFDRTEDSKRLSTSGEAINVKKRFKRPKSGPLPFSYDNLDSYFTSNGKDHLPSFRKRPVRHDVETSDWKAFEEYTKSSDDLSRNMCDLICGSIISTFNILGIPYKAKVSGKFLETLSIRQSVRTLSKNTNSGFPFFGRKNDPKVINGTIKWVQDYLSQPRFYTLEKQFLKESSKGINDTPPFSDLSTQPVHIMHRFQIAPLERLGKEFETKIRPVWCVPFNVVALENLFFAEMIESVKRSALTQDEPIFPIGLTNKQLSKNVALPFSRKMRRSVGRIARSFDFSKFDRTVHSLFTSAIFTIWGTNFNFSEKKQKAYDSLRFFTCFTPFIYDNKIMVTRKGVCSGSFTTNIRDTIVNIAIITMALRIKYNCEEVAQAALNDIFFKISDSMHSFRMDIRKGLHHIDVRGCHVYGDDGILIESDDFFLIHQKICEELGMTIKYEYTLEEGSFFFLGRFWDTNGIPWQTYSYMMAHIMFRTKWYKAEDVKFNISEKLDLYRVLSICLPLRDGKQFLFDMFSEWDKFREFLDNDKGFYLLKEWPHESYVYIPRHKAFDVLSY